MTICRHKKQAHKKEAHKGTTRRPAHNKIHQTITFYSVTAVFPYVHHLPLHHPSFLTCLLGSRRCPPPEAHLERYPSFVRQEEEPKEPDPFQHQTYEYLSGRKQKKE